MFTEITHTLSDGRKTVYSGTKRRQPTDSRRTQRRLEDGEISVTDEQSFTLASGVTITGRVYE